MTQLRKQGLSFKYHCFNGCGSTSVPSFDQHLHHGLLLCLYATAIATLHMSRLLDCGFYRMCVLR